MSQNEDEKVALSLEALPITAFRDEIVTTIRENPVTIIVADTGAGKSTQIPKYLLKEGATVLVTQPRRLAARTVSARIAWEINQELGEEVGFRTAHEHRHGPLTRCLFVTDGLALVRSLLGRGQTDVLVIDEVHEQNLNVEVLLAWAKLQLSQESKFRVVVMSATMEAEKIAAYFDGAPIMNIPGRLFPVEERDPSPDILDDVVALLKEGRNVLVFQPGKQEIQVMVEKIREQIPGIAEILPLHGELEPNEQAKAFRSYDKPKCVVSTNVAQTSVTIPDIDAVVDGGEEKRIEVRDGVEGLYLRPISLADSKQRKGRAGRTKPGIYVNHCPHREQPDYPTPEIERLLLDHVVLRLAEAGLDAAELEFLHQPNHEKIVEAKETLRALGCLDHEGAVTEMGSVIARMPVSVQYGRMIIEADRLGVVDDVITIAALLESGAITARDNERWQDLCRNEHTSDVLAQLAIVHAIYGKKHNHERLVELGIHPKAYGRFLETRKHLQEIVRPLVRNPGSTQDREAIIQCIVTGMINHLFTRVQYSRRGASYVNGTSTAMRRIDRRSVLQYDSPELLVGVPFDLNVRDRDFAELTNTINLITWGTAVTVEQLLATAPHLLRIAESEIRYEYYGDSISWTRSVYFGDRVIKTEYMVSKTHPEKQRLKAAWLADPINRRAYNLDALPEPARTPWTETQEVVPSYAPASRPAYQPVVTTHTLTHAQKRTYQCACGQTVEMGVIAYADLKSGRIKTTKLRCPKSSQEFVVSLE